MIDDTKPYICLRKVGDEYRWVVYRPYPYHLYGAIELETIAAIQYADKLNVARGARVCKVFPRKYLIKPIGVQ